MSAPKHFFHRRGNTALNHKCQNELLKNPHGEDRGWLAVRSLNFHDWKFSSVIMTRSSKHVEVRPRSRTTKERCLVPGVSWCEGERAAQSTHFTYERNTQKV